MDRETRAHQQRRVGDRQSTAPVAFFVVAAITLALALIGIITRQAGFLAAFWPANAVLIGLFVRIPKLATPLGWFGATLGFLFADLITGSSLAEMLLLALSNVVEVAVGYVALRTLAIEHQRLRRPFSILYVFLACLAAALAGALAGIWPGVVLLDMSVREAALTWFAWGLSGSMTILPLVLAFPTVSGERNIGGVLRDEFRRAAAPLAYLIASLAAGLAVGGPAAVMVAVPALLYCALVAGLFPTTVLNLIATAWTMIAITSTNILLLGELPPASTILSIQVGLSFLVMGPIAVAANVGAKDEAISQLRRTADTDALTGALTRRAFEREAGSMLAHLSSENRSVSVLMMDLDHFKQINDRRGHRVGDRVLVKFAELTKKSLRDSDIFGRIGGEEFAVVLPGVSHEMAAVIADRICGRFAESTVEAGPEDLTTTVSIGNAFFANAPADLSNALTIADHALYRAKQAGRNQVVNSLTGSGEADGSGPNVRIPRSL